METQNPTTAWFFGTFNPVHNGHLTMARAVLSAFPAFETVTFVPTGQPPHRQAGLAPAADRLAMARLATVEDERLRVSDVEAACDAPCYTYETLKRLGVLGLSEAPALIMGADAYNSLASWHRAADLLASAHFLVAPRQGVTLKTAFEIDGETLEPSFSIIPMPEMPVSASQIRERLAKNQSVEGLLPPGVAAYIHQADVYRPVLAGNG